MTEAFRKPEEVIAEILSRWSVSDLVEQFDEDLLRADELFHKAKQDMIVAEQGEHGLIKFWKVLSGGKHYEVRRFQQFSWCSCPSFFFSRKACKHIARTCRVACADCGELPARVGKLCPSCDVKQKHFLRPSRSVESVNAGNL